MPFILPLFAGISLTTVFVAVAVVVVVGMALGLGKKVSGVASSKPESTYVTNPQQLTFSADAPRRLVYGEPRVSGIVAYANVAGEGHEFLYMVVVLAAHKITNVSQIYFDGVLGDTVASGYYEWWWHDGTQTTADATLMATFPEWDFNCILKGCAYAVVKLKSDKSIWKGGQPNIQFDVLGKPVYDPRTGTTAYSNNGALVLADYMTSVDGLGATSAEMDWPSVIAAADIAAQLPSGMAGSLCACRYPIDGVVELSTKNGDVITAMTAALAGTVVWTEGMYRIYVGAARAPVARVITPEDLNGNPTLQPRTAAEQSFNCIKGTFLDSTNNWVISDFPPVVGDTYVTADGGIQVFKDIVLQFTTSPIIAQRLATIFLRRARLEKTITLPCKWTCFDYEVWDVVTLNLPQIGWIAKLFQITDWKMIPPTRTSPGGIELTLLEYSDAIYSDDMSLKPIDGGGMIIVPDVTIPKPLLAMYATSGPTAIDSAGNPRIRFDWPQSPDIYCVGYELAFGAYPFTPGDADYTQIPGRASISYTTGALTPGDTYMGYVRVVNSFDKRSAAVASNAVICTGSPSSFPDALQGLSATIFSNDYIDLTWTAPTNPASYTEILWANVNDIGAAAILATPALPTNSARLARRTEAGFYFARFVSVAGLKGAHGVVSAAAKTIGGGVTIVQSITFGELEGTLTNGVWVTPTIAVPKSTQLASALGWEVFDMMVPQPYGTVSYFAKSAVYVASGTINPVGTLGWTRAPTVPGSNPVVNAMAEVAYFGSTVYKQGSYTLTGDANIKLGFQASITDPQGSVFTTFNATLEKS